MHKRTLEYVTCKALGTCLAKCLLPLWSLYLLRMSGTAYAVVLHFSLWDGMVHCRTLRDTRFTEKLNSHKARARRLEIILSEWIIDL